MAEPSAVSLSTFFAVFEALPRQGPGNRACTARALALCAGLPPAPAIVDLGCGAGAQTLDLAELTGGTVLAVDSHAPFARLLAAGAARRGLTGRIRPLVVDMTDAGLPDACADLVWSEGAFYNIGLDAAFELSRRLLRPGGYLAFTDAVWRTDDPPGPAREAFAEYPAMGTVQDVLDRLDAHGFEVLGHFPLPESAWRDDFYTPMRTRVAELRAATPAADADVLVVLDACDAEIDLFEEHGTSFGYEFFVAR